MKPTSGTKMHLVYSTSSARTPTCDIDPPKRISDRRDDRQKLQMQKHWLSDDAGKAVVVVGEKQWLSVYNLCESPRDTLYIFQAAEPVPGFKLAAKP